MQLTAVALLVAGAAAAAAARRPPVRLPAGPPWPELQATPTLGYNGWLATTDGGKVNANQTLYYRIADKLVESGLAAAGFDTLLTVCIGWVRDPVTHRLEAPKATWPDGFKALADYVKKKGLKIGAYTDTGAVGCCKPHEIGSLGYEELDVRTFAEWGVDHISVDNCGHGGPEHTAATSIYEYKVRSEAKEREEEIGAREWPHHLGTRWEAESREWPHHLAVVVHRVVRVCVAHAI